jgi:hypothetical protein
MNINENIRHTILHLYITMYIFTWNFAKNDEIFSSTSDPRLHLRREASKNEINKPKTRSLIMLQTTAMQ